MNTILFVDHAVAIGGAEKSLLSLLDGLDRKRWSPHLACVDGALANLAAARDIPRHILPMPSLRQFNPVPWLKTIVALAKDIEADLLYANTARASLFAAPAALLGRRPLIWHMRDFSFVESGSRWAWMDRPLKWLVSRCASRVLANSQSVAEHLPACAAAQVIHNGIDPEAYDGALSQAESRVGFGLPPDLPVVGMLGRVRPWKGQERFLRVAAHVLRREERAHFIVAGGDPFEVGDSYATGLRELVIELGIADRVVFTDQLEDVRPALAAMDVFVHPGDPEPFGLVNLEAMAMGKPVVAFAHGALPEIVDHGNTGVLVPPGDIAEMASSVAILLRDAEGARAMGAAGAQRVCAEFSIARTVAAVQDVLASTTDRREE